MEQIRIAAVGDICLGDHLLTLGRGTRSLQRLRGPEYPFLAVREKLARADLRIGNLEGVLSDLGADEAEVTTQVMRGAPAAVESLAWAGFDVLSVANNHMAQYGVAAFQDTVERLQAAGIAAAGCRERDGCRPVVRRVHAQRIGVLAYSFVSERHVQGPTPYAAGRLDAIREDVEQLRDGVDCLVVCCHWGLELIDRPSEATIRLARQLIDWGADLILGHHPHVFQALERYRHGVICYSLGNFVFDTVWDDACRRTAIVEFTLERESSHWAIEWQLIPVWIADDYRPMLSNPVEATRFRERQRRISEPSYYDVYASAPRVEFRRYREEVARLERRSQWLKLGFVLRNLWRQDRRVLQQLAGKLIGRHPPVPGPAAEETR